MAKSPASSCDENLFIACQKSDVPLVKDLIGKGANPSALLMRKEADSTLHLVCGYLGNLDILKVLITHCNEKCNLKLRDNRGWTPLHHAASHSHKSIIFYLITELKCDPMIRTNTGETALHLTCQKHLYFAKKVSIVHCMIDEGSCDVNSRDAEGKTPLMLASARHNSQLVLKCLIDDFSCNLWLADNKGNTALHYACREKNVEVVQHILQFKDGNIDVKNNEGLTPLLSTCCPDSHNIEDKIVDILKLLIDENCDVKVTTNIGETAIMLVVKWVKVQCKKIIHYLVCCECDISATNHEGNTALHIACVRNNSKCVKALIKQKACDFSVKNVNGDTPLHIACLQGNDGIVSMLVSHSTRELYMFNGNNLSPFQIAVLYHSLNHELSTVLVLSMSKEHDQFKNGPFHLASMTNDMQLLEVAAELEYDVNSTNIDGDTPLHLACKFGRVKVAELLLQMNCDTTAQNGAGDNALLCALHAGHLDIVALVLKSTRFTSMLPDIYALLDNGLNPVFLKSIDFGQSTTILHILSSVGVHCDTLRFLKGCKCDYESRDTKGWTPLHCACYFGNVDAVTYMITEFSCGAKVKNIEGSTALHLACISPAGEALAYKIVTCLVKNAEHDINEMNGEGLSPLMLVIDLFRNEIAQYLILDRHCDLEVRSTNGSSALHLACAVGNEEAVKMILKAVGPNFDFDAKDNLGNTPLQLACKHNHQGIVIMLLEQNEYQIPAILSSWKCSTNAVILKHLMNTVCLRKDRNGNNALHIVCMNGDSQLGKLLVAQRRLLYQRNNHGDTPLHIACRRGHAELVDVLLHAKPFDVNTENNQGIIPFELACERIDQTMIESFLKVPFIDEVKIMITKLGTDLSNFLHVELAGSKNLLHLICGKLGDLDTLKCIVESSDCSQYLAVIDGQGQTPLHYACIFRHIDIVRYLVSEKEYDPTIKNSLGESLLHVSCKSHWVEIDKALLFIKFLIATCKLDFDACDCYGSSPLMLLLQRNPFMTNSIAKYLIVECRCDLSITNRHGNTALHIAAMTGNILAVRLLLLQSYYTDSEIAAAIKLNNGEISTTIDEILQVLPGDLNCGLYTQNSEALIPLLLAEKMDRREIVTLLIHVMYKYPDESGNTPLHLACKARNLHLVEKIVHMNNCATFASNNDGDTPLHIIVDSSRGDSMCIKLLITAGCDVVHQNNNGDTPLHLASSCGNIEAVKLILQSIAHSKSCVKQKNNMGKSPLYLAFINDHLHIASLLITGQDFNELELDDATLNVLDESLGTVKWIIKEGINPAQVLMLKFLDSRSFLHIACGTVGDLDAVQSLARPGKGNFNMKDDNGWTPLHHACFHGHPDIVECLVNNLVQECEYEASIIKFRPSPLQLACESNNSEHALLRIVKFLTAKGGCDPNTKTYNGGTLLIYLLKTMNTKLSIMHYLITEYRCDLVAKTRNGDTALHIACSSTTSNVDIIPMIAARGDCCTSKIKNRSGSVPLHLACLGANAQVVKTLLEQFKGKCGLYEINNRRQTPLQAALSQRVKRSDDKSIVQMLIDEMFRQPDEEGNTPLHMACETLNMPLLRLISESKECDVNHKNNNGDTALHVACRSRNYDVVNFVLNFDSKRNPESVSASVEINALNKSGDTPIHIACRSKNLKIVRSLILKICDTNVGDACGNTPLHIACEYGVLKLCEAVLKNCNINARNHSGDTPLLTACRYCRFEIIKLLINHPLIQIDVANHDGDTFLHVLCQSQACSSPIILYVLEVTHFDPNKKNCKGLTAIEYTTNPFIIQELVRFGANPKDTSRMQVDTKHPPKPVTKVFIVGNTSVGKSTLTAALQKESSRIVEVFTPAKRVSGVEDKTAGIIPYDFDSKMYGQVTLYDFAGHREFYSSHAVLLEKSVDVSTPVFLLVVDLRENYDDFKKSVLYWLSFLDNQCDVASKKPYIIIIGSHVDVLKSEKRKYDDKVQLIQHIQASSVITSMDIVGFVAMDCQYPQSAGMIKLRQFLKDCCNHLRSNFVETIRFNAHCFLVYLSDKFKETKAVTFEQIVTVIRHERETASDSSPLFFLPHSYQTLFDLCHDLNDRGHILLLKDKQVPSNSWIVFDKESLLSEVTGTIFAPEGLRQYADLSSSTGVVPLTRLSEKFSSHDPSMLAKLLTHLEYCHEISDQEILQIIGDEAGSDDTVSSDMHTYLFFPALVKLDAPANLWSPKTHFTNYCGWLLKCTKPDQFFTSRFLEVLLLRLAFSFALISSDSAATTDTPVIQRKCSIWKNGIFWSNSDGVDTFVEVLPDSKIVTAAMRFSEKNNLLALLELRSKVIQKVIDAVMQFCSKVETTEYFIDPSDVILYPIQTPTLYSMKDVTQVIFSRSSELMYVVPENGSALPIDALLTLEPYSLLHPAVVAELLNSDKTDHVPDFVLRKVAENVSKYSHAFTFGKIFDSGITAPPSSAQLYQILRMWKNSCEGTNASFCQKLNQYSIYGNRDIQVSSVILT